MIHDIAVLGGGIAGATAALRLARAGVQPVWIAPETPDDFKPGEHLSAAALPILKSLGSDAILRAQVHRHAHATYSAWGSDLLIERNAIIQLDGPPTVLNRNVFETALSDHALTAGARRRYESVVSVSVADHAWTIKTDASSIRARFIFDATGRKAIVASKHATRFQADKLACQYALYSAPATASPPPVTLIEAEEHGWWYLSVLADHRVVVNYYSDTDLPGLGTSSLDARARQTSALSTYLADNGYCISSAAKRVTTNSTWIAPAIGPGWVAIGDAAAAFDPLSSHGMTTALWSAMTAADAFLSRDRGKMQSYADATAKGIHDYLSARQRMYGYERRWPDSLFWSRRHTNALQAETYATV